MNILILILIGVFINYGLCLAAFTPTELFIINWGENANEILAVKGGRIDPGTPADSTDDYADPGGGPLYAFVDTYNNIIINSPDLQLKGFDSSGVLIFDFSADSPDHVEGMFWGGLDKLYVDDAKHVFLTTSWPMSYVPKINYETATVDSLKPYDNHPDMRISDLNWTYDGEIMFFSDSLGWITVVGQQKIAGGTWGVRQANGRDYGARLMTGDSVKVYSTANPDVWGHGTGKETSYITLGVGNLKWVELLKSMDPIHLYLYVGYFTDFAFYDIWKYDLQYNLVDKVIPPAEPAYYSSFPSPFITANGDIYEFRAREDGLHVIKWTKQ